MQFYDLKIAVRHYRDAVASGVLTLSHFDTIPSVIDGDSFGIGTKIALLPDGAVEVDFCLVEMLDNASLSNVPHS